ncbi:hypothetical protein N0V95_010039 [Ascochyta clinopodiicola]|nr:hypothetical protein N0V95_010039 [Ascochyta clinopodiicola]
MLIDQNLARNCTTISPCQQDSTIIRDSEIKQNIVNACGRTEISGNIDIGEQTENELAANRMTTVSSGTVMTVTIHQVSDMTSLFTTTNASKVNADGAGPYECDLDETSNAQTTLTPLKVANNVPGANGLSQAKEQDFTINVAMPDKFNCIGASTGNICTVRCRNTAVAGPFGGCFGVMQTDGKGRDSTAAGVKTAQTFEGISDQILQNQQDLPVAIAANQAAGAAGGNEGASAISALISATAAPTVAQQTAAAGNGNQNQNGGGNNQNAGNAGNANNGGGNRNGQNAGGNAGNAGGNAAGNQNAGNANGQGNGRGGQAQAGQGQGQAGQAGQGQAQAGQGQAQAGQGQAGQAGQGGRGGRGGRGNNKRSSSKFLSRFVL